jgi:hypothetical protein
MLMQIANQIVREYARRVLGLELDVGTPSWESVTLFKEEIDADLIPSDDLARLKSDPLIIIMTSFLDREGNSYVFGLVVDLFEEDNQGIEYAVCLKEGQLFEGNINWHRLLSE